MIFVLLALGIFVDAQAPLRAPTRGSCRAEAHVQAEAVVLAPLAEPGRRITMSGRVLDYAGHPLSRAAVVAYQADAGGLYNPPQSPTRVPRLRAVASTAEDGSFTFRTIVPGAYPSRSEPAHIHLTISAPAHRVKYADIWFEGDSLITAERMSHTLLPDAVTFIVAPQSTATGLAFHCDIRLDAN